jgi:hypothetical protein
MFRCSRCHNKNYCSVKDQRADWPEHRKTCFKMDTNLFFDQSPTIYGTTRLLQKALKVDLFVNYMKLLHDHENEELSIVDEILFHFYKAVVTMIMSDPISGIFRDPLTPEQRVKWSSCKKDIAKAHELMAEAHIDKEDDLYECGDKCHEFVFYTIHCRIDVD